MNQEKKNPISPLWLAGRMVIACCFLFFLVGLVKFGLKNLLLDKGCKDAEVIRKVNEFIYRDNPGIELVKHTRIPIDWEERYPFATEGKKEAQVETKLSRNQRGFWEDKMTSLKSTISYYYEKVLLWKKNIMETGATTAHLFKWDMPESVKKEPYIFWGKREGYISQCKSRIDVSEITESLIGFAEWVQGKGISFVYVQYPAKMSGMVADNLPEGYVSYTDENADQILEKLEEENIPFLDIRAYLMPQNADNMFALFFRTDHHWLPQTGLRVAGILADYFRQRGVDHEEKLFDSKNYMVENYEGIFLGSYGRDVTAGLIDPDDFPLVMPDFETRFKISIPDIKMELEGCFEETLLDRNMLYPKPSYELSQYAVYCWGNYPLIRIQNLCAQNHKRILILKDSFGNVVNPYLAQAFEEMHLIDPRYFTGSIKAYIEQYQPDYVMVTYNPGIIRKIEEDVPHTSPWDFR